MGPQDASQISSNQVAQQQSFGDVVIISVPGWWPSQSHEGESATEQWKKNKAEKRTKN